MKYVHRAINTRTVACRFSALIRGYVRARQGNRAGILAQFIRVLLFFKSTLVENSSKNS